MGGDKRENQEKKEAGDVLFELKRKFDNFIYHYKYAMLASIALAAIVIYSAVQCSLKTEGDVSIEYVGPKSFDAVEYSYVQTNFNELLAEDMNGDGEVFAEFTQLLYMTDIQIEDAKADGQIIDVQSIRVAETQLGMEIINGDNIIFFLSPEAYKLMIKSGEVNNFMYIEDALGYTPDSGIMYDEFAVRLSALPCYEYYLGISGFPPDTLVAVREQRIDDKENDEKYRNNLAMFKRIVEFQF
jgi:hypothetical protein